MSVVIAKLNCHLLTVINIYKPKPTITNNNFCYIFSPCKLQAGFSRAGFHQGSIIFELEPLKTKGAMKRHAPCEHKLHLVMF